MKYEIEFRPDAKKALAKIAKRDRLRIEGAIELLSENPFPPSSKKLRVRPEYSLRVGDYRILYQVIKNRMIIEVITLGHRKEIYKK
jgi:mRNA interferase RelE/StbE